MSESCALDPNAGCPNVEPVRTLAHHKVAFAARDLAVRFPELARLTSLLGFPNNEAGSIHGSKVLEFSATSQFPARSPTPRGHWIPYRRTASRPSCPRLEATHPHGAPKQQPTWPPGFPNGRAVRRTGRLYDGPNIFASVSQSDDIRSLAQVARAMKPSAPPSYPSCDLGPICADPREAPVSLQLPAPRRQPQTRMPMLEALRLA